MVPFSLLVTKFIKIPCHLPLQTGWQVGAVAALYKEEKMPNAPVQSRQIWAVTLRVTTAGICNTASALTVTDTTRFWSATILNFYLKIKLV